MKRVVILRTEYYMRRRYVQNLESRNAERGKTLAALAALALLAGGRLSVGDGINIDKFELQRREWTRGERDHVVVDEEECLRGGPRSDCSKVASRMGCTCPDGDGCR